MLYSIQYLRAVAAIFIILFHLSGHRDGAGAPVFSFSVGPAGVDIFFVISGFVMWVTTARSSPSPPEFARRRVVRIAPLYWLVTITMFVMPSISGTIAGATIPQVDHLIASLLFLPYPYPANTSQIFPVYVPGWTINYEMFFYALFAVALFIKQPAFRLLGLIAPLVALVIFGHATGATGIIGWYTEPMILEFAAGALIGAWFISERKPLSAPAALLLFVGGWLCLFLLAGSGPHGLSAGGSAALIIIGAISLERAGFVPCSVPLKFLGDASYAMYLTHLFSLGIFAVAWSRFGPGPTPFDNHAFAYVVLALIASIGFAALVHVWIEKPLSGLANRLTLRFSRQKLPSVQNSPHAEETRKTL